MAPRKSKHHGLIEAIKGRHATILKTVGASRSNALFVVEEEPGQKDLKDLHSCFQEAELALLKAQEILFRLESV